MLDAGESYFDDFLHDHTDGLTTWQVDEAEIEVPIVDELVGALVEMLRDVATPQSDHAWAIKRRKAHEQARAVIAKAKASIL